MSLNDYREAVATDLRAVLPASVHVETHGGRFDEGEIKRVGGKAPAVFVAVLDVADIEAGNGAILGDVTMGAFVATKDAPAMRRDEAALALAVVVTRRVALAEWPAEHTPQRVAARNLFSASQDRTGLALWAVSWRQRVAIAPLEDQDPATLDEFLLCHVDTRLVEGAPVATDDINLPQGDPT